MLKIDFRTLSRLFSTSLLILPNTSSVVLDEIYRLIWVSTWSTIRRLGHKSIEFGFSPLEIHAFEMREVIELRLLLKLVMK
jgi:hypothetical protein